MWWCCSYLELSTARVDRDIASAVRPLLLQCCCRRAPLCCCKDVVYCRTTSFRAYIGFPLRIMGRGFLAPVSSSYASLTQTWWRVTIVVAMVLYNVAQHYLELTLVSLAHNGKGFPCAGQLFLRWSCSDLVACDPSLNHLLEADWLML